ncbi:hypothetical protein [Stenotrophomonas phage BUCT603B1]|nr:hypothetical protein [Stenotrophomonas phage BUCT603B1]
MTRGELRAIITADPARLEALVKEALLQELQPILQRIVEEEVQAFLHGTSAEPPQGVLS